MRIEFVAGIFRDMLDRAQAGTLEFFVSTRSKVETTVYDALELVRSGLCPKFENITRGFVEQGWSTFEGLHYTRRRSNNF